MVVGGRAGTSAQTATTVVGKSTVSYLGRTDLNKQFNSSGYNNTGAMINSIKIVDSSGDWDYF